MGDGLPGVSPWEREVSVPESWESKRCLVPHGAKDEV